MAREVGREMFLNSGKVGYLFEEAFIFWLVITGSTTSFE